MVKNEEEGGECCMCGDRGLPSELFKCINCGLRSQHKYCSNLYPGAASYNNCNWCLSLKHDKTQQQQQQQHISKSHKTTSSDHRHLKILKKSKKDINPGDTNHHKQVKKQNKLAAPVPSAGRKRVTSDGGGRIIKRSRSEEIANNGGIMKKPVFRNKVRRYKLLDEVSSQ